MEEMLPQTDERRQRLIEALMGQQGAAGSQGGLLQMLQNSTRGLPQGGAMAIPSGLMHGALQGLNLQRLMQPKPQMPPAPAIPR